MSLFADIRRGMQDWHINKIPLPPTVEEEFDALLEGELTEARKKKVVQFLLEKSDKFFSFQITPPPSPKKS